MSTVARYFNVQPELIGGESGGSLTYANVEQRALDFLQFCLRPWIVRTELALSALLSTTTSVKFNAAGLVRTDLLTRYQAHESAIRAGWKLRSECGSWRTSPLWPASTTRKDRRWHDPRPRPHDLPRPARWGRRPNPPRAAPAVGVPARVIDRGRMVAETFERGALVGTDPGRVPSPPPTRETPAPSPSASPSSWRTAPMPPGGRGA